MLAGYSRSDSDPAWRHSPAYAMVFHLQFPARSRATGSSLPPLRAHSERKETMNGRDSRTEELLSELTEQYSGRDAKVRRISRRRLFRSLAGNTVVSAIGVGGLLELLASREALAAGMQITIDGVTREPNQAD